MRALVTGGAGFLGSHLCEYLLNRGFQVVALDNLVTGAETNVITLERSDGFQLVKADVAEMPELGLDFQVIFHLACPASPKDYQEHPIETMRAESLGTFSTLDLARRCGARYVLASTSEVYGDPTVSPQPETYWGNVNPVGPRSSYDESKRFAEALSIAYCQSYGVDVRIGRIFNTYGPRMRASDGRVVPAFLTQALRREPLTVFGDGRQTRSLCYVSDTVDGLFCLATVDDLSELVFNIGAPYELTMLELAELVKELCGTEVPVNFAPLPRDDPKRRCPDINRARQLLGWEPLIPVREGLLRTIDHFRGVLARSAVGASGRKRVES